MIDKVLHTPEGVRDIYNAECEKKLTLENKIHEIFHTYGFKDIQTPTFEYFDVFSKERGTVSSRDMYKFFDREGDTLVLRPDITPPIARCISKYYRDEQLPIRLCYKGNTYINNNSYQGKLKETTQMGVELINDSSIDADAEMISLCINCLLKSGLTEFQIEIGHVNFFKALVLEANLSEEEEEELRGRIEDKNMFAVEEILKDKEISKELKALFLQIPELFGPLEKISKIKEATKNQQAIEAIEYLEKLYEILTIYGLEKYVSFDLGMLSMYNYYTSIIFRAYTYGTGDAVLGGGRYDNLLEQFGKAAPAIGMAINIDQLMEALARQNRLELPSPERTMIIYDQLYRQDAISLANHLRCEKMHIILCCTKVEREITEYLNYAKVNQIGCILILKNNSNIDVINVSTKQIRKVNLDSFMNE